MRVSVFPNDTGYENFPEWRGCTVRVDGEVVEKVFTADTDLGEVTCADLKDGKPYLDGDEIATRTLRGRVEIQK